MVLKTSTVLTYPPCTWVNFFYVDPTDSNFVRQTWFYRSKVVYFDGYRFAFDLLQKAISHTGFLRDLPRWKWWSLCSWKLIHHHCADAQTQHAEIKVGFYLRIKFEFSRQNLAHESKSNVKTKKSWKHRVWLFGLNNLIFRLQKDPVRCVVVSF